LLVLTGKENANNEKIIHKKIQIIFQGTSSFETNKNITKKPAKIFAGT